MKKTIFIIITIIILVAAIFMALTFDWGRRGNITATSTSTTTSDLPIVVFSPTENETVSSPIVITGKARGNWYFEAVFPIDLINSNGDIIGHGQARADSDWTTLDFVNFHAYIEYPATSTGRALLVLRKDNPSDNPEFDQSIFVPVILK